MKILNAIWHSVHIDEWQWNQITFDTVEYSTCKMYSWDASRCWLFYMQTREILEPPDHIQEKKYCIM